MNGYPLREPRAIKSVIIKRIHIDPERRDERGHPDQAGHWWFEIHPGDSAPEESYGWYPAERVTLQSCFLGVDGLLNGGYMRDPHHGEESPDEQFCPHVAADDKRTETQIHDCLREFAKNYSGKWQWFLGWGKNCHTFQRAAMRD
ncbi:MAG: hypothetical protein AAFU85_03665 [Planctomycetota bacterium]